MFFIPPPFTIKPYYKRRSLCFRICDGTTASIGNLSGYDLPYDRTKNAWGEGFIPDTFKAGTGVQIVIYGAVRDLNDSGVEKTVVIKPIIYRGRNGVVGVTTVTPDPSLISIPNNEPADNIRRITLSTIPGFQAGDVFTWRLWRSHIEELDTWDFNFYICRKVVMKYIAYTIGVEV